MGIIKNVDRKNRFAEIFNTKTGFYMRTGVIDKEGKDTGEDPFMREFPSLIDVGIMHKCLHGKSGLCIKSGVECYQDGLNSNKPNMTLDNYKKIINESKNKVFQVALGGSGDPNKHEHFGEILKYTVDNGIVPNYTTSGLDLTDEEIMLTKEFCGATAVSWYDRGKEGYTYKAIERFISAGVKTNIHYVLGNNSIDEALEMLKNNSFPKGINAVILLTHKPVGLGSKKNVLQADDPRVKEFFELIDTGKFEHKIGFDSCTVPGIINFTDNIDPDSLDTCEGGRWSMYITADMIALPCSFDNQDLRWGVDLKEKTIEESWNSEEFDDFREKFKSGCGDCKDHNSCFSGCPIVPEIVLCNRKEKDIKV